MIDFTLTEDQELIRRTARDFAENEIRPVAERVDAMAEGGDTWAIVRPVFEQAAELGFTTFYIPEPFGGSGRSPMDGAIFIEEIAAVDIGIAMTLGATMGYPMFILAAGTDEQKQQFLPALCDGELHILAGAQSEPDVAGSELFCTDADPALGMRTRARRDGDEYVLNGSKSAFITNAGIADHYFIVARTDLARPQADTLSLFYVPAGTPGLHVGRRTHMLGMKTGHHAELRLEDVRVPALNLIGGEGAALGILSTVLGQGLGAPFVGLARAAYRYALDYARQRRSWGKPLIEHQAIALMLADMEMHVRAARLLTWDSVHAAERFDPSMTLKAMAAKAYAVDVAIRTTQNAVKVLGAYGVSREYKAAKYLCDAMMGYALDFTGDLLRIRMAAQLP
ncbi:MAG: acyl-CoA dehydrogenase family protein [Gammaproteobacteria bacterium]|nr:acyl-CoA dehydrogenase family protein [Gammaproteobacteria bacterium]